MENTPFNVSSTDRTHLASRRPGFFAKELIEAVRTVSRLEDVAGQHVHLKPSGSQLVGRCPFHSDRTPSFAVSPNKQMFRCHGCGVGGDVFTFVREQANRSFAEAVKLLAQRAGISVESFQPSAELSARIAEVHARREEQAAFERFCNERVEAISGRFRALGRAAKHAEDCLHAGESDPHIHELAWQALERWHSFEQRIERERLLDVDALRTEWQVQGGHHVAA